MQVPTYRFQSWRKEVAPFVIPNSQGCDDFSNSTSNFRHTKLVRKNNEDVFLRAAKFFASISRVVSWYQKTDVSSTNSATPGTTSQGDASARSAPWPKPNCGQLLILPRISCRKKSPYVVTNLQKNCMVLIFIKKNEYFHPQFDPLESLLEIDPTHGWHRIGTPSCALGRDEEHTLPGNEPISHLWLHTEFDSIRKKPSHVKSFFAEAQSGTGTTWRKVCLTITHGFCPWCGTCRWQSSIQPSYWHQKKDET